MIKKISVLLVGLVSSFLLINQVYAATANVSVKASTTRMVVGNSVKVTVTISSTSPLGSWEYDLNYDKSLMKLVSSDVTLHYAYVASNSNTKSVSYAYNFKAIKSGSAKFYVTSPAVIGWDESAMTVKSSSVTVTVITQAQLEASYSKDNYLKSLSVEGYEITPIFNKETLEYSLELEPLTTSIIVEGIKNDSKASVSGLGEKTLSVGLNKLEIIVTAQNGSQRKYIINATVKELKPIILTYQNKEYTVIRSLEGFNIPKTYEKINLAIDEEQVEALHNELVDYTLLLLKDEAGTSKLFLYNPNTKTLDNYEYLDFGSLSIRILEPTEILDNYENGLENINNQEIKVLKLTNDSDYSLIYGLNLETNEENYYSYDSLESTLQRYNQEESKEVSKDANDYLTLVIIFAASSIILLIALISILNKNKPKIKKEKPEKKAKEEKEPKTKKQQPKSKDKLDEWFEE